METIDGRRFVVCVAVLFALAVHSRNARADNLFLLGTAGFTTSNGDVGDLFVENGVVLGGKLLVGLNSRFFLSGGAHLSIFGGQSELGVEITEFGVAFTFEGGGVVYLVDRQSADVRPFLGANVGYGILAWDYSSAATVVFGVDSDSVGFLFFAPEAGLEIAVGDRASVHVGIRFLISGYADETEENFIWDPDGGDFLQAYTGIAFGL